MHFIQAATAIFAFGISTAVADFHVAQTYTPYTGNEMVAAPSNYYTCKAFMEGDRAVRGGPGDDIESNFFLYGGLCGLGKMNFYQESDGKSWKFYEDGGNGDALGDCYPSSGEMSCTGGTVDDRLVCYSYVCGSG